LSFSGRGWSGAKPTVRNALRSLGLATVEILSLYTNLPVPIVRAILTKERRGWCDIWDHEIKRGYSRKGNWRSWEVAIWQYTGLGAPL
jgi:hypothetical protein